MAETDIRFSKLIESLIESIPFKANAQIDATTRGSLNIYTPLICARQRQPRTDSTNTLKQWCNSVQERLSCVHTALHCYTLVYCTVVACVICHIAASHRDVLHVSPERWQMFATNRSTTPRATQRRASRLAQNRMRTFAAGVDVKCIYRICDTRVGFCVCGIHVEITSIANRSHWMTGTRHATETKSWLRYYIAEWVAIAFGMYMYIFNHILSILSRPMSSLPTTYRRRYHAIYY